MAGDVPLRRSLLLRLLALSALVSLCSVAATTWLAVRTTTNAIQREQGQAFTDDARIYDDLIGYAATHPDWKGAAPLVDKLARQTGHRITLTDPSRRPLLDSASSGDRLPEHASATVDPLAVDTDLLPDAASDTIDARAVGPFRLTAAEHRHLDMDAEGVVRCLRLRLGETVDLVTTPSGRPVVRTQSGSTLSTPSCVSSALDEPVPTEQRALAQLDALVTPCLARRKLPPVEVQIDHSWIWSRRAGGSTRAVSPVSSATERLAADCVTVARREQLAPFVSPAALLFVSAPGTGPARNGFQLSRANEERIATLAVVVLLLSVAVTTLAGRRMTRPLQTLTRAARRMTEGDDSARVRVTGGDEIGRLAVAFNDMSEHRSRLERQRKDMVSDIAHELRTPLSNIRGWLEAVADGIAVPDPTLLSSLLEEALLLQHVIDDLRDLSAADSGELRLTREPVDTRDLLTQTATAHQSGADTAGVRLTVTGGPPEPLTADPVRLRQAVGNLVSNAIRHTPAGGTVTLSCGRDGEFVLIDVADTGTGIAADDLPYVFDRFWRAEKSRSRRTGGSGLGLAIVRKLVEAHGGSAAVHSTPGRGTVFTLRLPAT